MSSALKKITTRAKQLQRKHPNSKWTSLIKKAGVEYRAGKLGATKPKAKYRQTGKSNKKADRERSARPPGKRVPRGGSKPTYTERRKNRSDVPGSLTGMSAGRLRSELVKRLKDKVNNAVVKRYNATKKTIKKKWNKTIVATNAQLRKLQ